MRRTCHSGSAPSIEMDSISSSISRGRFMPLAPATESRRSNVARARGDRLSSVSVAKVFLEFGSRPRAMLVDGRLNGTRFVFARFIEIGFDSAGNNQTGVIEPLQEQSQGF